MRSLLVVLLDSTKGELHPADTGVGGDNFPADIKSFQVHRTSSHYLLRGSWKRERPPSQC